MALYSYRDLRDVAFSPLLHWNHLRNGQFDNWRYLANRSERAELAEVCGEWLIAMGYELDHSWVEASADDAWRTWRGINQIAQRVLAEIEPELA